MVTMQNYDHESLIVIAVQGRTYRCTLTVSRMAHGMDDSETALELIPSRPGQAPTYLGLSSRFNSENISYPWQYW